MPKTPPNPSLGKKREEKVKAWALLIDGELDVNYDIFDTAKMARRYRIGYRSGKEQLVSVEITYTLPSKKI